MLIRGIHAMFYLSQAAELRAFFRDKLGLKGTDVGEGWLIFDPPEADLGVHPAEADGSGTRSGRPTFPFIAMTSVRRSRTLRSRGIEFAQDIEDHRYGLVTFFRRLPTSQFSPINRNTASNLGCLYRAA